MAPAVSESLLKPDCRKTSNFAPAAAVEVFAVQLRDAARQPVRLSPEQAVLEPLRDVAVLPLPFLEALQAQSRLCSEWLEPLPGWRLSQAKVHARRVALCGIVREVFSSRKSIRFAIDDGTAVAKAQCTGPLSKVVCQSTVEVPGRAYSPELKVGALVHCSGRVDWYEGECICMVEQMQIFSSNENVHAEVLWWKRVIDRQRQLATAQGIPISMQTDKPT